MPKKAILASVAVAVVVLAGSPAYASGSHGHRSDHRTAGFTQINQVSDQPGQANVTDSNLVNSWGLALSPTSPLWVANNGTNTATVYSGGLHGAAVKKVPLTVRIPGGAPTGEVFNDTRSFRVSGRGKTRPATFIFASEGGDITAWNKTTNGTEAALVKHVPGAVFKGLALLHTRFGPFLLATDFVNGQIDVFDSRFRRVVLPDFFFHDPRLPKGYGPFNVFVDGSAVIVTYAKQSGGTDEEHGPGLGFVDEYRNFGLDVQRIASRGTLNAPWGVAIAPKGFGHISGALLVGNFGDGRINVFIHGRFAGQLSDKHNCPITIDGLWALLPGTATTGGANTLWFSSGPGDEEHGLVGQLVSKS
jgi:uncharacterized protein (TIGR03118 family)